MSNKNSLSKSDLNGLISEIESRKKTVSNVDGSGATPKDRFLNGLLTSLKTGSETQSSKLIKEVDNQVSLRSDEKPVHVINETQTQNVKQSRPIRTNEDYGNQSYDVERDELAFNEIQKKHKKTNNLGFADQLESYMPTTNRRQVNENLVNNDNLLGIVNNYLNENITSIIEENTKNIILEIYGEEKIKKVLNENRDYIKKIVYEIIREIQQKNVKK